jgi:hypothetical protein
VCVHTWPLIIGQWIRCGRLNVYVSRWVKLKVVILKRLESGLSMYSIGDLTEEISSRENQLTSIINTRWVMLSMK